MKRTTCLLVGLILMVFSLGSVFGDDNMFLVEGGTFIMGDTAGGGDEKPTHSVTVSGFYMNKYEVTVGEFRSFVQDTGYKTTAETSGGGWVWTGSTWEQKADANWKNPYMSQTDKDPVVLVSWYDVVEYCNWKSKKEGLTLCYSISGTNVTCKWSANGYRLPTEAEWEYAAKGGKLSKGYRYAGSNSEGSVAWYGVNSGNTTHPVGTKEPNELNLYDLSGNVWEWCWDWFGDYSASSQTDPRGASTGSDRVSRGGCTPGFPDLLPSSFRGHSAPDDRNSFSGFRPVRIDKNSLVSSFADSKLFRINTPDGLNLRDAPTTQGKILALIPGGTAVSMLEEKGEALTIQGVTGKWTKVQWKELQGWVFGGFLERISAPVVTQPAALATAPSGMVLVEGGTFTMGDTAGGGESNEKPTHSVTVSGFYMNTYEVTQKEFKDVMGFNPSNFKGDNLPVEMITWYDAVAYCNSKSQKEGLRQVYGITGISKNSSGNITAAEVSADFTAGGYRLPTEAEWEYAAKGGKLSKGYKYAGSNSEGSVAWYFSNSGSKTQPVGTKTANELGIYDLSGNVYEWCWDWYGWYGSSSLVEGPAGPTRVRRGGGWFHVADSLRSSNRGNCTPDSRGDDLGFRPVRTK